MVKERNDDAEPDEAEGMLFAGIEGVLGERLSRPATPAQ
jgi:hypothetical protein